MALVPACEEKDRLLRAYAFAASDHSRAVAVLAKYSGVMRRERYEKLRAYTEGTRKRMDAASAALERHAKSHGC